MICWIQNYCREFSPHICCLSTLNSVTVGGSVQSFFLIKYELTDDDWRNIVLQSLGLNWNGGA
jgi:hypothetical protein